MVVKLGFIDDIVYNLYTNVVLFFGVCQGTFPFVETKPPNLFEYRDYRLYLQDWWEQRKKVDRHLSLRSFAQRAGYESFSLFRNIVGGVRNLTPHYLPGFQKALGLGSREREFFALLVEFTHSSTQDGRNALWEVMRTFLPLEERRLDERHREFWEHWYHPVVLQALFVLDVADDHSRLRQFLTPSIGAVEARRSIRLLADLGLIEPNGDGFWKPTGRSLVGGFEVGSHHIRRHQDAMIEKAREALDRFVPSRRLVVSETLSIPARAEPQLRHRIEAFRRELVEWVLAQEGEDQVVQINLQYFPLTQTRTQGEEPT